VVKQISQVDAQANFEQLCGQVIASGEAIVIQRSQPGNVVLIAEKDLTSLLETLYLFRSPANASRLLQAMKQAKAGTTPPQSIEDLAQKLGLDLQDDLPDEVAAAS
jgi:antitoxin YefM